jgi:hypothetical protein
VTVNLREGQFGRVTFEFDSESAAASSGYMLELVVTVASVALADGGRLPVEEPRLRQVLAAGLGVAEMKALSREQRIESDFFERFERWIPVSRGIEVEAVPE